MRWSPYNYVRDNPIKRYDPNGMDDYTINEDGKVKRKRTKDKSDNFVYVSSDGQRKNLGTYEKNKNGYLKVPKSGSNFNNHSKESKSYVNARTWAGILGAGEKYQQETGKKIEINQLNTAEGFHSGADMKGGGADLQYSSKDGGYPRTTNSNIDKSDSQVLIDALGSFGFEKGANVKRILTENSAGTGAAFDNSSYVNGKTATPPYEHQSHLHLQRSSLDIQDVADSPPVPIILPNLNNNFYFQSDNTKLGNNPMGGW
jgi:hypothetical protein